MKTVLLSTVLFFLSLQNLLSQCDIVNTLQVINQPGVTLQADVECTDTQGWTHYYHSGSGRLLLSIKKNGQDIGSLGGNLIVEAGTVSGYGNGAQDLSVADYIDNDTWIVANRYWQVKGANTITAPVQIRFYFHQSDIVDISGVVDDFGFLVNEPGDLYMFTLGGGGNLFPFSTNTQPVNADFTLFDMAPGPSPDWTGGTLNGYPFSQFSVNTLDIGGSAGFLIFQPDPTVSVSGQIKKANGDPVKDVKVEATASSIDITDAGGHYSCPALVVGGGYTIVPSKNSDPAVGISVIDLIYMARHLMGLEPFGSPFQIIAADADNNFTLSNNDLEQVRAVLLGDLPAFPHNDAWRFVPATYVFSNPSNPLLESFPGTIQIPLLTDSLAGQNFTGIKIGDVANEPSTNPPSFNTGFSLPDLVTCNHGDTVIFDLTVQDFTNVKGFQFSLEWDTDVLTFLSVQNFGLAGLGPFSFGTGLASSGKLPLVWYTPDNNGATLSNGASICQLVFVAKGNDLDQTSIAITSSPTAPQVVHNNLSQKMPGFSAGHFMIENNAVISAITQIEPVGCDEQNLGSIDLTVNGAVLPLSYHWSTGVTVQDIVGLTKGMYQVTIEDASGLCPKVFEFEVGNHSDIIPHVSITQASNSSTKDGAVIIHSIEGGKPPFTFLWNNGATSQSLGNVLPGDYTVTIADAAGCKQTFDYQVKDAMVHTGQEPGSIRNLQFSPNPVSIGENGYLKLTIDTSARLDISVFNSMGEEWRRWLWPVTVGQNALLIEAPAVPGIYFIRVKRDGGLVDWLDFVVF